MKNPFLVIVNLLFLFSLPWSNSRVMAQDNDVLIRTKEQNDVWLAEVSELSQQKLLHALAKRILADTNFIVQPFTCRVNVQSKTTGDSSKIAVECKPIILIDGQTFYFVNLGKEEVEALALVLKTGKFKSVSVYHNKDPKSNATALFGSRGKCGAFILVSDNRKTRKRISEIVANNH